MARSTSDDLKIKGFGLAAYLLVESLIDRLRQSGVISGAEIQILFLDALNKCSVHAHPASPWPDETAQVHDILAKEPLAKLGTELILWIFAVLD